MVDDAEKRPAVVEGQEALDAMLAAVLRRAEEWLRGARACMTADAF